MDESPVPHAEQKEPDPSIYTTCFYSCEGQEQAGQIHGARGQDRIYFVCGGYWLGESTRAPSVVLNHYWLGKVIWKCKQVKASCPTTDFLLLTLWFYVTKDFAWAIRAWREYAASCRLEKIFTVGISESQHVASYKCAKHWKCILQKRITTCPESTGKVA